MCIRDRLYGNGTFKLAFKTGTWAQPWIHPFTAFESIGTDPIVDKPMDSPRQDGDDELWQVKEGGMYTLRFNLKYFTYSSTYEGPIPVDPDKEQCLYLVGNVTPNNPTWDIDNLDKLVQSADDKDVYTYHGILNPGCFKLCFETGTWAQAFIHPLVNNEEVGETNVTDKPMGEARQGGYDELWAVVKSGVYTLTFNIRDNLWSSVYEGEIPVEGDDEPIEADMVYIFGDATTAGWEMGHGIEMTRSADDPYVFSWQGNLGDGWFLFSLSNTDWDKMIRPVEQYKYIGHGATVDYKFRYPNDDDNNFVVDEPGEYRLVINLRTRTISTEYVGEGGEPVGPGPDEPYDPIEADMVYIFGDATPAGWEMGKGVEMTRSTDDPYVYSWTGHLNKGWMLFSLSNTDWDKMIRPVETYKYFGTGPTVDYKFVYPNPNGDNNFVIDTAGTFTLTVDLRHRTISTSYTE